MGCTYGKDKHIRVCADFSTVLNECLKTYEYSLPSAKDIFAKLNCSKVFSKIDLFDAYKQVMVDEETSKLLTNNTLKGLYSFNRLPFKVAPGVFQRIMDDRLAELDFAMAYLDDILIKDETIEQHRIHVKEVFKKN